MNIAIEVYPWDLEDEGIDTVLARIAGDLGADTVTVGAILPETHSIRRRATTGPRVIRMPSGAHFQPDGRFYAGTRIRPVTAPWLRQRNPLERIARRVADHRLNLRIRLSCCDVPALVEKYPMAGTIDVYGEPHGERLCPSNPEVRAYLCAAVEDLCANYKPVAIEVGSIRIEGRNPSDPTFSSAADVTPLEALLLNTCFCPACKERGEQKGLDVGGAAADVRDELERQFSAVQTSDMASSYDVLKGRQRIVDYRLSQSEAGMSLLEQLHERSKCPLVLRGDDADPATVLAVAKGAYADALSIPDVGSNQTLESLKSHLLKSNDPKRIEIRFRPMAGLPRYDGQSLVRSVKDAFDRGHSAVGFSDYGAMSEPALDSIRQAIRFAKRG